MKKYIPIILMLLMIPLLNEGCKTEDLSVGWEIKADTLVFYSDEGVASWCADVKAREDSANVPPLCSWTQLRLFRKECLRTIHTFRR